jgi:uncharacterized protein YcbK (DUF882 family)
MSLLTFRKGSDAKLSDHFTSNEFDCACNSAVCETQIDEDLITKLEALRAQTGPLKINSGYRCQAYQDELRARGYPTSAGPSTHSEGRAADVEPTNTRLAGVTIEPLARAAGFMAVGVAPTWIHVDLRNDKIRRWTYAK